MTIDTRTSGSLTKERITFKKDNWQSNKWVNQYTSVTDSPQIFGQIKSVTSFRGKRSSGFSINPFSLTKTECISGPPINVIAYWSEKQMYTTIQMRESVTGSASWYRYDPVHTNYDPSQPFAALSDGALKQRALLGAYGKVHSPKFDLGVNLGELRETFEMLHSPFSSFRKLLKGLGKKRSARNVVDDLAGSWMEQRYGVMPLVYTIRDIIRLAQSRQVFVPNHLYSGRSQATTVATYRYLDDPYRNVNGFYMKPVNFYTCSLRAASIVYFHYTRPPSLGYLLGIDISSIPAVAWELTKLSWLVDWWLGIGDFLKAHRYSPDVAIQGSCTTTIKRCELISTVLPDITFRGVKVPTDPFTLTVSQDNVVRAIAGAPSAFPLMDFSWSSVLHTVDALCLSWQKIPIRR